MDQLFADEDHVRLESGVLIATVWVEYPEKKRMAGESWLEMMARLEPAQNSAKEVAYQRAKRFAASDHMLTALETILSTARLSTGEQAIVANAIAKATGRDVADVVRGA